MKLFEILDTDPSQVTTPFRGSDALRKHITDINSNPKVKPIANGSFAYIHHVDDPHEMDRVIRTADDYDIGNKWLQYIVDHPELHNNPFVPKVRAVGTKSNGISSYQVEPLHPFDAIDDNVKRSLARRYFIDKLDLDNKNLDNLYIDVLDASLVNHMTIRDPQLKQALSSINDLKNQLENQGLYAKRDFHDGNVMWRLTPQGPQLVITDPLWVPVKESWGKNVATGVLASAMALGSVYKHESDKIQQRNPSTKPHISQQYTSPSIEKPVEKPVENYGPVLPEYEHMIDKIVGTYKVDPKLAANIVVLAHKYADPVFPKAPDILKVIGVESSFIPTAVSKLKEDPAIGLMQVRPGKWEIDPSELSTIEGQIKHGSKILNKYYHKLKGNKEAALQAYNVGLRNFRKGVRAPKYIQKYKQVHATLETPPKTQG